MKLVLKYDSCAHDNEQGWERESLPIGCGYIGANIFGITNRERIQITENSLVNTFRHGGLNSMADIYVETNHVETSNYLRGLTLNDATAWCNYICDGVQYKREYFTSYPDRCLVARFEASEKTFQCKVTLAIPHLKEYDIEPNDGYAKRGKVEVLGDTLVMQGVMEYHDIHFCSLLKVITDGNLKSENDGIAVSNSSYVELRFVCATNYRLRREAFVAPPKEKTDKTIDALQVAKGLMENCNKYAYCQLKQRHVDDFSKYFGRVTFELAGADDQLCTDKLLQKYSQGEHSPYLEMLYFQFGRYLLISSSRKGALPPNLQGVWNCHDHAPWGSGYWHNINIQMNYWPTFSTNLAEMFDSYSDFNCTWRNATAVYSREHLLKYLPTQRLTQSLLDAGIDISPYENGKEFLQNVAEEKLEEICGWVCGTGIFPYSLEGPGGHSGPGTAGLTTKIFADRYYFTLDKEKLVKYDLPILQSLSRFYTKCVDDYDGDLLSAFSASPEQAIGEVWNNYYHTTGCAFDQQMIYENGVDFLKLAQVVGMDNVDTKIQRQQINRYAPVLIGKSGHVKEFREENFYGEIGEYNHRHLSQLVALFPGATINRNTPAWLDAVKVSLNERGDQSTGWALAHRLCSWARVGDGNRAYKLLNNLLGCKTLPNLWDNHPPFQIDGNFGGCAGIAEMLLQSHQNQIEILPALPDSWKKGRFEGLVARGHFEVGVTWENCHPTKIVIKSLSAQKCKVCYPLIEKANLSVENAVRGNGYVEFDTVVEGEYYITNIPYQPKTPDVEQVTYANGKLVWNKVANATYTILVAVDNEPNYTTVATDLTQNEMEIALPKATDHVVFKVVATRENHLPSNGKTAVAPKLDDALTNQLK